MQGHKEHRFNGGNHSMLQNILKSYCLETKSKIKVQKQIIKEQKVLTSLNSPRHQRFLIPSQQAC